MRKGIVEGIGINDADYPVTEYMMRHGKRIISRICPFYKTWKSMLVRCYNIKYKKLNTTYKNCTVCEDWLKFSNFKSWMETQDWKDKCLDKDILGTGELYSKDTCCFVDQALNKFLTDSRAKRGEYLIGVDLHESGKFRSRCSNPITNKSEFLGLFSCELDAHKAWLSRKIELAHLIAKNIKDPRISSALIHKYESWVE